TPQCLAGLSVMGGEKTACVELATTLADVHDAVADARRAGDGIRQAAVGDLHIPDLAAGFSVQRDQAPVDRSDDDLAVPVRGAAVRDVAADAARGQFARHLRIELPQLLAGHGIEGEDLAPWPGQVKLAVDDQRRALVAALV